MSNLKTCFLTTVAINRHTGPEQTTIDFRLRKKWDCTIHVVKTKALISCAFVSAYANSKYFHDSSYILSLVMRKTAFAYAKTKTQISVFVLATWIVQSLFQSKSEISSL